MSRHDYEITIGLEVHAQLTTRSKMFCACPVQFAEPPNTLCCPVCLGLPGALPVLNEAAIDKTILAGLMLGCRINDIAKWDRKNYFYPDMPKNYQISQFDLPLCVGGSVPLYTTAFPKDTPKDVVLSGRSIALTRIHLEEDVGKSTHHGQNSTIDFNRAGTPLMEIVSEPDLKTPEDAVAYLGSLRQILIYGGVSDADMEKGQLRCDVNISVRPKGQVELGPKVELKNLNSLSSVRRALIHEIERQSDDLDKGIIQRQSTRRWDDDLGETQLMRTKEDAHDYRYFPDPDLLPVQSGKMRERIRILVPELPHEKRARFVSQYGISEYDAEQLASDQSLASYFEAAAKNASAPKKVANWVINDLLSALNEGQVDLNQSKVTPLALGELVTIIESGKISNAQGKEIFAELFARGGNPAEIIKEKGFEQVSDSGALATLVDQVLAENADTVAKIKAGNAKAINALQGQVMKLSKGKANPRMVAEMLTERMK